MPDPARDGRSSILQGASPLQVSWLVGIPSPNYDFEAL